MSSIQHIFLQGSTPSKFCGNANHTCSSCREIFSQNKNFVVHHFSRDLANNREITYLHPVFCSKDCLGPSLPETCPHCSSVIHESLISVSDFSPAVTSSHADASNRGFGRDTTNAMRPLDSPANASRSALLDARVNNSKAALQDAKQFEKDCFRLEVLDPKSFAQDADSELVLNHLSEFKSFAKQELMTNYRYRILSRVSEVSLLDRAAFIRMLKIACEFGWLDVLTLLSSAYKENPRLLMEGFSKDDLKEFSNEVQAFVLHNFN